MNNDMQSLFNVIAILAKKLGGEVTLTEAELQTPPVGVVTRNPNGSITLKVDE